MCEGLENKVSPRRFAAACEEEELRAVINELDRVAAVIRGFTRAMKETI